ncbi:MAG: hypothetical protein J5957_13430, partial [Prevotella sp.]|nr:hypothetical protein [Prevotella sp.]
GATVFLITGDASRNKIQTMPGGGFSTVAIELPDKWDALMKGLGYQPLEGYRLEPTHTTEINQAKGTSYRKNANARMYNTRGQQLNRRPSRGVYIQSGRIMLSR